MTVTLIPCCAWCSRLKDADGWPVGQPVDTSTGPYTHGVCRACRPLLEAQVDAVVVERRLS